MPQSNISLSVAGAQNHLNAAQKVSISGICLGLLFCVIALMNIQLPNAALFLVASIVLLIGGTIIYARATYLNQPKGIKNNGVFLRSFTNAGVLGWCAGIVLTAFYIILYWYPQYLGLGVNGLPNTGLVKFFDPLSLLLKNQIASQWFVYGVFYTISILALGYKFILKYRHNKYQIVRTISVMFFQLGFAFLIPEFLIRLNYPYNDFKNMWPLNYYFFDGWHIKELIAHGGLGLVMLLFGVAMIFIISPILTYFYGKRWYCSWVCGCGGLAETAGDPFRQLSDKSLKAWRIERVLIHAVLVFSILMTIGVLYSFTIENPEGFYLTRELLIGITAVVLFGVLGVLWLRPKLFKSIHPNTKLVISGTLLSIIGIAIWAYASNQSTIFFIDSSKLRQWYGFFIGSAFSGVIGVGFYPILGSRVWCRFGCPMAAILGLQQRFFSRFRITTNGAQCISCGNCSTYCEMGIDVRAYAQKGQNIVRASCVGCGICAAVCPRGVLKLENGPNNEKRTAIQLTAIHLIPREDINIL